jgi:hypothetical protein
MIPIMPDEEFQEIERGRKKRSMGSRAGLDYGRGLGSFLFQFYRSSKNPFIFSPFPSIYFLVTGVLRNGDGDWPCWSYSHDRKRVGP